MTFDKTTATKVYNDIEAMVNIYLKTSGYTLERIRGNYGDLTFKIHLELRAVSSTGETQEQRDYKAYAPPHFRDWLGQAIQNTKGELFEVRGWRKSARKNKVLITNEVGESRVCSIAFLQRCTLIS